MLTPKNNPFMAKNKRRRKASTSQTLKQVQAQQRKIFFEKIQSILIACKCPDLLKSISKDSKESMFRVRFAPIKIIAKNGLKAIDLKIFNRTLNYLLQDKKYTLVDRNYPVTAYDLISAGLTLYCFCEIESKKQPDKFRNILEKLAPLKEAFDGDDSVLSYRLTSFHTVCMANNNFARYMFSCVINDSDEKSSTSSDTVELYKHTPERRKICIDGFNRTVYQVGWFYNNEYFPSIINTNNISSDITLAKSEYKVFIQIHALNRLRERIHEDIDGILQSELFSSLDDAKNCTYKNNRIYIDYYFTKHKAGYLVGEIIDGIIVIKTFLFLTHSSTPEGEHLKELTGLNKLDMKYLKIDSLKVFQESDIKEHPEIKQIFIDAGCGSLFKIRNDEFESSTIRIANKLLNYMQDSRKDYNSVKELEEDMQAQAV